jgi:hypothetical protein
LLCESKGDKVIPVTVSKVLLILVLLSPLPEVAPITPVYVTASLTDKNGLFIEDLKQEEITIRESGRERKIEFMAKDEIPTIYGIVFDRALLPEFLENNRSGPAAGATSAKEMGYELIDKYLGRQSIWIGVYDRELEVALEPSTDGFTAKDTIQQIRGAHRPKESFLYGAILSAVTKMNLRHENRRVLLIFWGALDSESAGKISPLKNLLSSSNIEIFLVSFASKLGAASSALHPQMSQVGLRELAQVTAGEAYFTADHRDHLEELTRRIYNAIRTLYTFGFQAESSAEKPGALMVKCSRPGSKIRHHPTVAVQ